MLKKLAYALVLTGLVSGQAFALTDPGFENGNNWITPTGSLTRVDYGSAGANVVVRNDSIPGSGLGGVAKDRYGNEVGNITVDAVPTATLVGSVGVGSSFGLIETCAANVLADNCDKQPSTSTFNLGGPVSHYGDYFLVRLMSADFEVRYNDKVTVTYYGTAGVLATDHVSVVSENPSDASWVEFEPYDGVVDSGWAAFGVPVGTNAIQVLVENRADPTDVDYQPGYELYNRPLVAIDYAAAVSPVPEADVTAMMLAGLGVLGMVSRRRAKRAA